MNDYTLKRSHRPHYPTHNLPLGKKFTVTGDLQLKNGQWLPTTVQGQLVSVADSKNPHKPYNILSLINNRRMLKVRLLKTVASCAG